MRNKKNTDYKERTAKPKPEGSVGSESDLPFVITKIELARALRVSKKHVENLTRRGLLTPVRLGRSIRYTRETVLRSLEKLGGASK